MTTFQKIGPSLSFLKETGNLNKEDLIKNQIEAIQAQSMHYGKRWTPLHITDDRLSAICSEVLSHQLEIQPEEDPGRSFWTEITQRLDKVGTTPPNPPPRTYLSTNGRSWDVVFIPREEKQAAPLSQASGQNISKMMIKVITDSIDENGVYVNYPSPAIPPFSVEPAYGTTARAATTEEKTSNTAKALMLSFHTKNPRTPLLRKIKTTVTPKTVSDYYKSKFNRASIEADPRKHHEYRGMLNFYSYGFIDYPGPDNTTTHSLLEVEIDTQKLRKRRKEIGRLPPAEAIFPLMKECLEVVRGPVKSHVPVVQRRLSLGLIRVHQQLSDLGIPTYHAWIAKSKYACDADINLEENPWVPKIDHLKLIKYTAPENMANINRDGTVTGYVPHPAEDIWALGIIFFILLWDGKEPEFLKLHKKIRDLAKADPFDQEAFDRAKKNLVKAYHVFQARHCGEAEKEPLKQIVLDMLQLNRKARISAAECLDRLKAYIESKKE